ALILIKKETAPAVDQLAKTIKRHQITVFFVTTALFNVLVDFEKECLKNVRKILFGGERVSVGHTSRALEYLGKGKIIHVYGPTETTVYATYYFVDKVTDNASIIPIGKPLANTSIYIMDKYMNLAPIGACGEIYIGGAGNARGYLNNPELTAERFVNFHHSKFYKTGDLGRWFPDGNIEFIGRIDQQIKIRGFRIEPGEIENCLLKHKHIKEAVVVVNEGDEKDKILAAYFVSTGEVDETVLRQYLLGLLPVYMVPAYFVSLTKIPLTPNGKVDRAALPKPGLKAGESYSPPRDEIEKKLVELCSEVLGSGTFGIDDNFFQLGIHSLKAAVLVSRIHKTFNAVLPLAELFKTPTIRGVSEYLRRTAKHIYESIMPVEEKEYYVLSFAQQRMYILQQMDLNSTAYNMPQWIPLTGEFDIEKLLETFKKLIKRHDSLRTSFHMIGDQPVQKIHRDIDFKIEKIEWSHFVRPFDLTQAPLLRVGLTEGNRYLLVDMHHIISDGISHEVLRDDFKAFYEGKELPSLRIQYKDFVQWQNSPEELGRIHRQMLYWLNEFAGEIPVLELPLDYPRPLVQSFDGAGIEFEFSLEQTGSLNEIALQAGATLFMVLTAVIDVLLAKISGQEEIIIGTPTAGRQHSDLEKIIGMFVNTLAIKNYPIGERTFGDFLADVKERMLMVFDNREYPFEALVDKLVLNRDTGRNPLFDVMFSWQNMSDDYQSPKPGSQYEYHVAKFDLTFTAVEIDQKLFISIQYCTQLFKPETIDRFILYFRKVIDSVIENKDQRISGIEIISKEE
ncbi:MAG TPA: condensation domain-containing protein, partial [Candidatus Kapabacteria bacterium]|nr:condensation domain-containing protein [Candidatus Kapabacteria bacterium]